MEPVGAMDDNDRAALPCGADHEPDPDGESLVSDPGAAFFRRRPTQSGSVVKERRIGQHQIERRLGQVFESAPDIPRPGLGAFGHMIVRYVPLGHGEHIRIALNPHKPRLRPPGRGRQQGRADAAARFENACAVRRIAGRGEQGRVNARTVSPGGLTQSQAPVQEGVVGELHASPFRLARLP